MSEENNIPTDEPNDEQDIPVNKSDTPAPDAPAPPNPDDLGDRLERLGGEPAPVITPEEFARLQKAGQVHIDSKGRVRTANRTTSSSGANEAGVSLRKRRAWYV